MFAGFDGFRASLQRAYSRVQGGESTPLRFALSVALGLFVGAQPFYGFHFALCAALAVPLRLNLLVSYLAAHISIPPTLPFLLYAGMQVGSLLLTGRTVPLALKDVRPAEFLELGGQLLVGSLLLGVGLALVGGLCAYLLAKSWRSQRLAEGSLSAALLDAAVKRTTARYLAAPRQHLSYVYFKLRVDPLARQLMVAMSEHGPRARALDVGAGRGQFGLLLLELGLVSTVFGLDHDVRKVEAACVAAGAGAHFVQGEASTSVYPDSDLVLLLDVLHYLPLAEQVEVLRRSVACLSVGGLLLVRETNWGAGFGARLAAALDRVGRRLGINRAASLSFVAPPSIATQLRALGMQVTLGEGEGLLDNVLLVGEKVPTGPL